MRELTVKRARKILGKSAENISDEDLLVEIKAAQLLKNLFFSNLLKQSSSNYTQGTHGEKANITKT